MVLERPNHSDEEDWRLPGQDGEIAPTPSRAQEPGKRVRLLEGELQVLDYVISSGSHLQLGIDLQALMEFWDAFRTSVWEALNAAARNPDAFPYGHILVIDEALLPILLTTVPTTMTWGDGIDHAYFLKLKLYQLRAGIYVDDAKAAMQAAAEAEQKQQTEAATAVIISAKAKVDRGRAEVLEKQGAIAKARVEAEAAVVAAEKTLAEAEVALTLAMAAGVRVGIPVKDVKEAEDASTDSTSEAQGNAEDHAQDPSGS